MRFKDLKVDVGDHIRWQCKGVIRDYEYLGGGQGRRLDVDIECPLSVEAPYWEILTRGSGYIAR